MERRATSPIPPILRNHLHQTPRMRPQTWLLNPLSNLVRNMHRLHHLTEPIVVIIIIAAAVFAIDHGAVGGSIEHQRKYADGGNVVFFVVCGTGALEVVMGGGFG